MTKQQQQQLIMKHITIHQQQFIIHQLSIFSNIPIFIHFEHPNTELKIISDPTLHSNQNTTNYNQMEKCLCIIRAKPLAYMKLSHSSAEKLEFVGLSGKAVTHEL
ncbi:hypothetical protein MTR_0091s0070 [Medicago truncatula]|uniref:Uncharacterized protein n=1 Tax=Medicago truncatula TaxID=3880 RepID=A0A072THT9_MEDTR|nr:hypothetical protein MTR_0091s0070 [Medicago truncatula]